MLEIDKELNKAGENGKYQQLLLWLIILPTQLPYSVQHYCQLLTSWTPDHWCRVSRVYNDDSVLYWNIREAMVKEYKDSRFRHSQCVLNRTLVFNIIREHKGARKKRFSSGKGRNSLAKCEKDWIYNRSWLGRTNTIVTEWDLVCDRSWLPTFALMLFGVGEFLSLPLYFYITYRQGRRFSFFLFLACECLFGSLTAFAPNIGCFALLRFLVGLTVPACAATPAALAQELVGSKSKGRNLHLMYLYRSLGGVLLAGSVFVVRDWPHIALASTVPFGAFFLYWWVLPESPQWLLARGRFEETIRLIRTIASTNGRELTPDFIVATKRKFILERSLREHRNEPRTQKEATKDLFKVRGLRKRIIVIIFTWLTSTASFLGLNYLCVELQGDVHLNLLLSAVTEVLGWAIAALMLRCGSRRCSYCVTCALGGVLCVTMATRRRGKSASLTLFVSTKLSVSISYFVLPLWTAELIPHGPRETAIVLSEILSLLCPVFLPLLIYQGRTLHSLPMTLIGVLQILGGLVALGLPETRLQNTLNQPAVVPLVPYADPWADHNCAHCHNSPKCNPRNGIRNANPVPESPIFSLLRCQENQISYSGRESSMSDLSGTKTLERQLSLDELKVTVL
ncbi:beta-alanine transporter-like [Uloborus diversus]|uniref:beta-alanine transporter-like n=1 Tax=Uloborus diversus TaxID=327109 RepID=UPI002409EE02|nr:beta-alanine transporter-like [Uloborus diversus]